MKIYQKHDKQEAVKSVTSFSETAGIEVHRLWIDLFGELFRRSRDFYTNFEKGKEGDEPVCEASEPGMTAAVKESIVQGTDNHCRVAEKSAVPVVRTW
jgi:hypothetical protein